MTGPVPSSAQPIGYSRDGAPVMIDRIWQRFFNSIGGVPTSLAGQAITASPHQFTAPVPGNLLVTGGTVSAITLQRGTTSIPVPTSGFIPMGINDIVSVTYSVAPTLTFIPS